MVRIRAVILSCIGCSGTVTIPLTRSDVSATLPRDFPDDDADDCDGVCQKCYDGFVEWLCYLGDSVSRRSNC
jgi:hypothetical protein